jgi:NAD-reducing hydrogenase small subunit
MQKPKVATVWLEGCSGCHMSFLDLDETLLDILKQVELTVTPITDFKDYRFPQVDLGIIEGGIGNDEQAEIARHLRGNAKIILALGDCAVFGGLNTLRNWIPKEEILRYGYIESMSTVGGAIPTFNGLPKLLDKVLPVSGVITVDAYLPGCPPSSDVIAYGLTEILNGRLPVLPREMIHFD